MTAEEFNALPEEARRYIENQKICLSCGKSLDLNAHYKNYLKMKNEKLFTLRIGAISFVADKKDKKSKVLYPLHDKDTAEVRKEKLELALKLHEARPDLFSVCNVSEIEKELGTKKESKAPKAPVTSKANAPVKKEAAPVKTEEPKAPVKEDDKIDHEVTEQDLIDYPELVERGVKVGDIVKVKKEEE